MKSNKKILLVEDDPNFGRILKDYLTINNYEVYLAVNGIEGFEKFNWFLSKNEFPNPPIDNCCEKDDGAKSPIPKKEYGEYVLTWEKVIRGRKNNK